jgi:hypothetical protein
MKNNIAKETDNLGSFQEVNQDKSNKSVLDSTNKITKSVVLQDDIFINAFKQIKINVTPIENALKPLPKKGRNTENQIFIGNNISAGMSFSKNNNLMYITEKKEEKNEIDRGGLIERSLKNHIIIESNQTSSKYNCSKQISNFFC